MKRFLRARAWSRDARSARRCKNFSLSGCPIDNDEKWVALTEWEEFEAALFAGPTGAEE